MTPEEQKQIDAIEKDRRDKEKLLLLLMLGFFGKATNHAAYAIRLGYDPIEAANDVITGNASLNLPGLTGPMSKLLARSYEDGVSRAVRLAAEVSGGSADEPPYASQPISEQPLPIYQAAAKRIVDAMAATFAGKINTAVDDSQAAGDGIGKMAAAVKRAMKACGYGVGIGADGKPVDPFTLQVVTERAIVDAHGAGMFSGYGRSRVLGFIHRSVVDDRTTAICRCRNGFCRPRGDSYWRWNWPSLHWRCRSCILPFNDASRWSDDYPEVLPMVGFGRAPWLFGLFPPPAKAA